MGHDEPNDAGDAHRSTRRVRRRETEARPPSVQMIQRAGSRPRDSTVWTRVADRRTRRTSGEHRCRRPGASADQQPGARPSVGEPARSRWSRRSRTAPQTRPGRRDPSRTSSRSRTTSTRNMTVTASARRLQSTAEVGLFASPGSASRAGHRRGLAADAARSVVGTNRMTTHASTIAARRERRPTPNRCRDQRTSGYRLARSINTNSTTMPTARPCHWQLAACGARREPPRRGRARRRSTATTATVASTTCSATPRRWIVEHAPFRRPRSVPDTQRATIPTPARHYAADDGNVASSIRKITIAARFAPRRRRSAAVR